MQLPLRVSSHIELESVSSSKSAIVHKYEN